jgi:enoyl-CoA hydratase
MREPLSFLEYETILVDKKSGVGYITLNRPQQLNALNTQVQNDVVAALQSFDKDPDVRAIILTGSGKKAFAAGADVKEMAAKPFSEVYKTNMFSDWDRIMDIRKPIIAAVNGFALGGGCELAMLCDIIIAADTAKFGQPEILLGTIPGMGGGQRLVRSIGKSKAMEWVLTGEHYTAEQAEKAGLVSRVVPADKLMEEAERLAQKIASMSGSAVVMGKEAVNAAFESGLRQGLAFERRLFYSSFATKDQKEGMDAFVNKRKAGWKDE